MTAEDYGRKLKLASLMAENNLPMRMVESATFKDFVTDLCQEYKYAERLEISRSLIPKLADQVEAKFIGQVKQLDDYSLCVEYDHWQDLSYRSVLGVAATRPDGTRYLYDSEDVSLVGHSASNIISSLERCPNNIPKNKINSIMSDSASNVKAARYRLAMKLPFSQVIEHRCLARLCNNIGTKLNRTPEVDEIIRKATELTDRLRNTMVFHHQYVGELNRG